METKDYAQMPPMMPKTWLVESIAVTILCCLPFGIAGIVYASQVNSKFAIGDYNGALEASKNDGKWTKVAFFTGLPGIILYFVVVVLMLGAGFSGQL